VNAVNITIFALFLLVVLYKNWLPGLMGWIEDRVRS
jgi:hypothetical protein